MAPKFKGWCFTINNWTPEDLQAVYDCSRVRYFVLGKEVGESGTPHLQGYIYFESQRTLTAVHSDIPRAHLEPARGTPQQASEYCKKDGDFEEHGELPHSQERKGIDEKARWKRVRELALENNLADIDDDIFVRYYGTLKRIAQDHQRLPDPITDLDFHWFVGASGTGKSRTAREENPMYYEKNLNKWWDGFTDQPCVIIEEWHPSVVPALCQMLKKWCDHHPFSAETKGGTTCIRPKKIIITSNYTMEECFSQDLTGLLLPLKRRIQVREF